jgi:hypothetical protein
MKPEFLTVCIIFVRCKSFEGLCEKSAVFFCKFALKIAPRVKSNLAILDFYNADREGMEFNNAYKKI